MSLAVCGESQAPARARNFLPNQGGKPEGDSGIDEVFQRRFGRKGPLAARLDFCHRLLGRNRRSPRLEPLTVSSQPKLSLSLGVKQVYTGAVSSLVVLISSCLVRNPKAQNQNFLQGFCLPVRCPYHVACVRWSEASLLLLDPTEHVRIALGKLYFRAT